MQPKLELQPKTFVFVGGSGAGKGDVVTKVIDIFPDVRKPVSATTRSPRPGEKNGEHYHFFSREDFLARDQANHFLEVNQHKNGHLYGTPWSECQHIDSTVVFDVDPHGARKIKEHFGDRAVVIFIKPKSVRELWDRLRKRGTESTEDIRKRLKCYIDTEQHFEHEADYVVVNETGHFTRCFANVAGIMFKEMKGIVFTKDGTSGSGKNTLAEITAKEYNAIHIDSGRFFRTVAFNMEKVLGLVPDDPDLDKYLQRFLKHYHPKNYVNDSVYQLKMVDDIVSLWSQIPVVRETVFWLQMKTAYGSGNPVIVGQGRDTGSEIFPQADKKFFVDCPIEERAMRRFLAQPNRGSYEKILENLRQRDLMDTTRKISPLMRTDEMALLENIFPPDIMLNTIMNEVTPIIRSREQSLVA